jgi:hypothetical protein
MPKRESPESVASPPKAAASKLSDKKYLEPQETSETAQETLENIQNAETTQSQAWAARRKERGE